LQNGIVCGVASRAAPNSETLLTVDGRMGHTTPLSGETRAFHGGQQRLRFGGESGASGRVVRRAPSLLGIFFHREKAECPPARRARYSPVFFPPPPPPSPPIVNGTGPDCWPRGGGGARQSGGREKGESNQ
jgi:hypothetical protein